VLLERGADVNAQGGQYGNALQAASDSGHEEIVQVLLERGADVNAQGGLYGNALQAASHSGCYNTVRTPTLCKPDTSDRPYLFSFQPT
jgi:ankyrin repeat protein